jgi:hypothetical protein
MHPIRAVALAAAAVLAVSIPTLSFAHDESHGTEHGDSYGTDDGFTWAIIEGDNSSMSGQLDHDLIEKLKDRFGDRFLYVEDDEDGYVITDRALVERAHRASRRIGQYGREIGEIARTQVRLTLSESRPKIRRAELLREQAELRREIDRAEQRGDDTEALERRLDRLTTKLEVSDPVDQGFQLSAEEKQDLTKRRDHAKARLREAVKQTNDEMHSILREAKSRRIAERVD